MPIPKILHRLRLRTKITLGVTFMLVFCGIGIGLILSNMSSSALIEEGKKRGMALTSGLALRLAEPILAMDFLQMKNFIDNVHSQYDDVIYVFLTDASGNILAHTFNGGFPTDLLGVNLDSRGAQPLLLATEERLIYDFNARVVLGDSNLGSVRLGLSRSDIDIQIRSQRLTSLVATLGVVGLGVVLALWFARTVTSRLIRLRESVEEIVRGNLDAHATLAGDKNFFDDELQDLAEAFDTMAMTVKNHIGELIEREKTIVRQQGLLKTIMSVTPDFITLQDRNLVYTFAGKAFCDDLDLPEAAVVGKTDYHIFPEQIAAINTEEGREILASGRTLAKEICLRRSDEKRWFHVIKIPVYDQDGSIIGVLSTARDISMLKKIQEQLVQSQKMEDLGRLAGGVAHEINTPLGIILGYSQILVEDIKDKELLEGMKIIEKQSQVCRKIVADLLGFARKSRSVSEAVDIVESIRTVANLVEHTFAMNDIQVVIDTDNTLPPLTGDDEKLKQVWLNLLNNAADAIDAGGIITVRARLGAEGKTIVVCVADTGKGVENAHITKVFDPFFTTKEVGKGTGLGLSVSFGIIKEHGGTIAVFSPCPAEYQPADFSRLEHCGPGTVFIVELPVPLFN